MEGQERLCCVGFVKLKISIASFGFVGRKASSVSVGSGVGHGCRGSRMLSQRDAFI